MMNYKLILPFLMSFLLLWSCTDPKIDDVTVDKTSADEAPVIPAKPVRVISPNATFEVKGKTYEGYEYIHHISNNTEKPQEGDQVTYHKLVTQNDTITLQSTYMLLEPRSDVLAPKATMPRPLHPIYDGLFLMSPGDSMTIYQPLTDYPADKLPQGVTNKDKFTYSIELLSIKPKNIIEQEIAATKARQQTVSDSLQQFIKDYKSGKLEDQIVTTESGLKYYIHEKGNGKKVKDGGFVKVHYLGMLEDGTVFDGTFEKVQPFAARIGRGRVIPGWDEGIALLNQGTEATFVIPHTLAYGAAGKPSNKPDVVSIPEKATLYFFISLVKTY